MSPRLHIIEIASGGRLALSARPRNGDELALDMQAYAQAGISTVLSLLTDDEILTLSLLDEPAQCALAGMTFLRWPIEDRSAPEQVPLELLEIVAQRVADGEAVLVHCRAGIGRSALVAVVLLAHLGVPPDDAWHRIADARGCPVPDTEEQRLWATAYAKQRLAEPPASDPESEFDELFG